LGSNISLEVHNKYFGVAPLDRKFSTIDGETFVRAGLLIYQCKNFTIGKLDGEQIACLLRIQNSRKFIVGPIGIAGNSAGVGVHMVSAKNIAHYRLGPMEAVNVVKHYEIRDAANLVLDYNDTSGTPGVSDIVRGIDFEFVLGNDLELSLPDYDLIFIDTEHEYDQLKKELFIYGDKAKKFLVFHDTNVESMTKAIY